MKLTTKLIKYIVPTERLASLFELIAVITVLAMALLLQFVFNELPCPLCLLQRIGFVGIAYGVILNLRFGFRPSHYAIVILSGLFTAFVALRQIALHVIPGTPAYGNALFGWHLYTWSFVLAMMVVIGTTLLFGVDRQYKVVVTRGKKKHWLVTAIFAVICFVLVANIIAVIFQCGFSACPDNPTAYVMW